VLRIGLTGGIASGKSAVAAEFAELGASIVDTDLIAREVTAPGSPALAAIVDQFGPEVLAADGGLDRQRLRGIVFADAAARRALEAIVHPRIRRLALARAEAAAGPYVIFVVPLLFETGFDRLVDRTLVVDCPETVQVERLRRRDGAGEQQARAIIAAQLGREARRQAADDLIDNSGDIEATRARVAELHERYLALSQNCSRNRGRAE
jgi:dephospho-CoA kinase